VQARLRTGANNSDSQLIVVDLRLTDLAGYRVGQLEQAGLADQYTILEIPRQHLRHTD